jgi:type VI secretion system protein ImpH
MRAKLSAMARLLKEPTRFSFDAALRVLMHGAKTGDPAAAARFRSPTSLAFPAGEIESVTTAAKGSALQVRVSLFALLGTTGVLPRVYGQMAALTARRGSTALHEFLDLLAHRLVAMFARAGIKYRLHRSSEAAALAPAPTQEPIAGALLALTGYATPGLLPRMEAGAEVLLHYSGFFATQPRSAERLRALVSDWLGEPVAVKQFAGGWLSLPVEQRSSLPGAQMPGAWNRLGVDAAIGLRSWDPQARIELRLGPLDRDAFTALLPDRPAHRQLVALVRAFLGLETGFAINPVLAHAASFPVRLSPAEEPRLGWNTWLTSPGTPRSEDGTEAAFEAD